MEKDWYKVIGAIVVAVVALCGLAALLHILVNVLPKNGAADWVVAVGTVGALIGTIYLARTETRRREKKERLSARLQAASMQNRIKSTHKVLIDTLAIFLNPDRGQLTTERLFMLADKLQLLNLWSTEEMVVLSPLKGGVAVQLAQAQIAIESLAVDVRNLAALSVRAPEAIPASAEPIKEKLDKTAGLIFNITAWCVIAEHELQQGVE